MDGLKLGVLKGGKQGLQELNLRCVSCSEQSAEQPQDHMEGKIKCKSEVGRNWESSFILAPAMWLITCLILINLICLLQLLLNRKSITGYEI